MTEQLTETKAKMKTLGAMYSMRETARLVGGTDSRTVQVKIAQAGIPTTTAGKMILIDEEGYRQIKAIYESERNRAKSA